MANEVLRKYSVVIDADTKALINALNDAQKKMESVDFGASVKKNVDELIKQINVMQTELKGATKDIRTSIDAITTGALKGEFNGLQKVVTSDINGLQDKIESLTKAVGVLNETGVNDLGNGINKTFSNIEEKINRVMDGFVAFQEFITSFKAGAFKNNALENVLEKNEQTIKKATKKQKEDFESLITDYQRMRETILQSVSNQTDLSTMTKMLGLLKNITQAYDDLDKKTRTDILGVGNINIGVIKDQTKTINENIHYYIEEVKSDLAGGTKPDIYLRWKTEINPDETAKDIEDKIKDDYIDPIQKWLDKDKNRLKLQIAIDKDQLNKTIKNAIKEENEELKKEKAPKIEVDLGIKGLKEDELKDNVDKITGAVETKANINGNVSSTITGGNIHIDNTNIATESTLSEIKDILSNWQGSGLPGEQKKEQIHEDVQVKKELDNAKNLIRSRRLDFVASKQQLQAAQDREDWEREAQFLSDMYKIYVNVNRKGIKNLRANPSLIENTPLWQATEIIDGKEYSKWGSRDLSNPIPIEEFRKKLKDEIANTTKNYFKEMSDAIKISLNAKTENLSLLGAEYDDEGKMLGRGSTAVGKDDIYRAAYNKVNDLKKRVLESGLEEEYQSLQLNKQKRDLIQQIIELSEKNPESEKLPALKEELRLLTRECTDQEKLNSLIEERKQLEQKRAKQNLNNEDFKKLLNNEKEQNALFKDAAPDMLEYAKSQAQLIDKVIDAQQARVDKMREEYYHDFRNTYGDIIREYSTQVTDSYTDKQGNIRHKTVSLNIADDKEYKKRLQEWKDMSKEFQILDASITKINNKGEVIKDYAALAPAEKERYGYLYNSVQTLGKCLNLYREMHKSVDKVSGGEKEFGEEVDNNVKKATKYTKIMSSLYEKASGTDVKGNKIVPTESKALEMASTEELREAAKQLSTIKDDKKSIETELKAEAKNYIKERIKMLENRIKNIDEDIKQETEKLVKAQNTGNEKSEKGIQTKIDSLKERRENLQVSVDLLKSDQNEGKEQTKILKTLKEKSNITEDQIKLLQKVLDISASIAKENDKQEYILDRSDIGHTDYTKEIKDMSNEEKSLRKELEDSNNKIIDLNKKRQLALNSLKNENTESNKHILDEIEKEIDNQQKLSNEISKKISEYEKAEGKNGKSSKTHISRTDKELKTSVDVQKNLRAKMRQLVGFDDTDKEVPLVKKLFEYLLSAGVTGVSEEQIASLFASKMANVISSSTVENIVSAQSQRMTESQKAKGTLDRIYEELGARENRYWKNYDAQKNKVESKPMSKSDLTKAINQAKKDAENASKEIETINNELEEINKKYIVSRGLSSKEYYKKEIDNLKEQILKKKADIQNEENLLENIRNTPVSTFTDKETKEYTRLKDKKTSGKRFTKKEKTDYERFLLKEEKDQQKTESNIRIAENNLEKFKQNANAEIRRLLDLINNRESLMNASDEKILSDENLKKYNEYINNEKKINDMLAEQNNYRVQNIDAIENEIKLNEEKITAMKKNPELFVKQDTDNNGNAVTRLMTQEEIEKSIESIQTNINKKKEELNANQKKYNSLLSDNEKKIKSIRDEQKDSLSITNNQQLMISSFNRSSEIATEFNKKYKEYVASYHTYGNNEDTIKLGEELVPLRDKYIASAMQYLSFGGDIQDLSDLFFNIDEKMKNVSNNYNLLIREKEELKEQAEQRKQIAISQIESYTNQRNELDLTKQQAKEAEKAAKAQEKAEQKRIEKLQKSREMTDDILKAEMAVANTAKSKRTEESSLFSYSNFNRVDKGMSDEQKFASFRVDKSLSNIQLIYGLIEKAKKLDIYDSEMQKETEKDLSDELELLHYFRDEAVKVGLHISSTTGRAVLDTAKDTTVLMKDMWTGLDQPYQKTKEQLKEFNKEQEKAKEKEKADAKSIGEKFKEQVLKNTRIARDAEREAKKQATEDKFTAGMTDEEKKIRQELEDANNKLIDLYKKRKANSKDVSEKEINDQKKVIGEIEKRIQATERLEVTKKGNIHHAQLKAEFRPYYKSSAGGKETSSSVSSTLPATEKTLAEIRDILKNGQIGKINKSKGEKIKSFTFNAPKNDKQWEEYNKLLEKNGVELKDVGNGHKKAVNKERDADKIRAAQEEWNEAHKKNVKATEKDTKATEESAKEKEKNTKETQKNTDTKKEDAKATKKSSKAKKEDAKATEENVSVKKDEKKETQKSGKAKKKETEAVEQTTVAEKENKKETEKVSKKKKEQTEQAKTFEQNKDLYYQIAKEKGWLNEKGNVLKEHRAETYLLMEERKPGSTGMSKQALDDIKKRIQETTKAQEELNKAESQDTTPTTEKKTRGKKKQTEATKEATKAQEELNQVEQKDTTSTTEKKTRGKKKQFDLNSIGKETIQKFIDGATAETDAEKEAFKKLAEIPVETIKDFLDISSPSRVMYQLGVWTGDGFNNGVLDSLGDLKSNLLQALKDGSISKEQAASVLDVDAWKNDKYLTDINMLDERKKLEHPVKNPKNTRAFKTLQNGVVSDAISEYEFQLRDRMQHEANAYNAIQEMFYRKDGKTTRAASSIKTWIKNNTDAALDAIKTWQDEMSGIIGHVPTLSEIIEYIFGTSNKANNTSVENAFKDVANKKIDEIFSMQKRLDLLKLKNANGKATYLDIVEIQQLTDALRDAEVEIKKYKEFGIDITAKTSDYNQFKDDLKTQQQSSLLNINKNQLNDLSKIQTTNSLYRDQVTIIQEIIREQEELYNNNQLIDSEKLNDATKRIQELQKYKNNPDVLISTSSAEVENILLRMHGIQKETVKTLDNGKLIVGTLQLENKQTQTLEYRYNEILGVYEQITKVQTQQLTLWDRTKIQIKKSWEYLKSYLGGYLSAQRLISLIRQGFQYVKELDKALTEMRKVSDETVSSLKAFQNESFEIAKSIGTTAVEIQNSAADFMRLGYSLKEASQLAKDANIYANVGDMQISEATEHMISSIQAWQSEFFSATDASIAIIDKYNEIGNNYAITSADIGSAMERSAAALKAAGNTLDESIGLITAGNLIQQDADTTANALKVMSLRLRGSKADLEDMGESTDDLADSTSKLRNELKALTGVDIMLNENEYKSTARIIQEIGANWDKLTDVSKAAALEKMAGKTRASTVAGLIENYKTIAEVAEDAAQSQGSALKENTKYVESIEGRVAKLQTQIQEFWHTFLESDALKTAISGLTEILNLLTKLVDTFGTIGTSGILGGSFFGLFKNFGRDEMLSLKYAKAYVFYTGNRNFNMGEWRHTTI